MEHLVYSFLNASLLFFLYNTDAFVEYVGLLRLGKLFRVEKYEKYLDTFGEGNYWEYLVYEKKTFLRKLLSCPFCVSFWMNIACFAFHKESVTLIVNLWLTLFLYLVLKFLLKKSL
jgi:hypothetical protein